MADMSSIDTALQTFRSTLTNLSTLINTLNSALSSPTPPTPTASNPGSSRPPNALLLLHTAATLLRAQTTKLSLLSLNKPFTPSAITSTLSLYARILPSLVSAVQLLSPASSTPPSKTAGSTAHYPAFFHTLVKTHVSSALSSLDALLAEVPRSDSDAQQTGAGRDGREGQTLKGTGVVWEECDWLTRAAERGVGALAEDRVRAWGELVGDAVGEVEEWVEEGGGEGEENEGEGELVDRMEDLGVHGSGSNGSGSGSGSRSGSDLGLFDDHPFRKEMRPLANEAVNTLKLVRMLFPPLLKRRMGRFPRADKDTKEERMLDAELCGRLNKLVDGCECLSEEADEVVATLYTGVQAEVKERLRELREKAIAVVDEARLAWDRSEDEFTAWTGKWVTKLTDTVAEFVLPGVQLKHA